MNNMDDMLFELKVDLTSDYNFDFLICIFNLYTMFFD